MSDIAERLREAFRELRVWTDAEPSGLLYPLEDMVDELLAERDRLRDALTKIATSSNQLPGQMFVAFAREVVTREALKETGHE